MKKRAKQRGGNPIGAILKFGVDQAIKAGKMPDRAIFKPSVKHTKVTKNKQGRKKRITYVFRSPSFGGGSTTGYF